MQKSSPPPEKSNVISINDGALVVRRRPGRPKAVRLAPPVLDADEHLYVEQLARAAEAFISADPVVAAATDQGSTQAARLDVVLQELAREGAALLWDRLKLQREGREGAPKASSRRIDALLQLARLVVAREHLRRSSGEMDDETIKQLVAMLVAVVEECVGDVAEPAVAAAFMEKLNAKMTAANFPLSAKLGPVT